MALRFVSGIRMLIDLGGVVPPPAKGQGGWGWPVFRKCGGRGGYLFGHRRGDYSPARPVPVPAVLRIFRRGAS